MKDYWLGLTPWKKLKFVISLLVGIFAIVFAVVNWQETPINFVFFEITISTTLLIVICLFAGYIVSNLLEFRRFKDKDLEIRRLKQQIEELMHRDREL